MLIKYHENAGADLVPAIIKNTEKSDVTKYGAFSLKEKITFTLKVPRRLGSSGVIFRYCEDGKRTYDIPLELTDTDFVTEVYSIRVNMADICTDKKYGSLIFYEFVFPRGNDTLFTDTNNNVDFRLSDKEESKFRMLVYTDDYKVPAWFGDAPVYHIFVDRFCKGNGQKKLRSTASLNEDWYGGIPQYAEIQGGDVENNMHFGGDLWGVADKLDYLASLGIGTIYLSPIFEAASNHKYDTADYEKVDTAFGGDAALINLIEKAKKKNIKIILDGVFNHTGDDSRYFNRKGYYDVIGAYQSEDSPYYGWYTFKNFPHKYECWWGIDVLPRLNLDNDECRHFFTGKGGIGERYIKMGIDGWRLDVADELNDIFLDELRVSVKGASSDAMIMGEVWENASDKVSYGKRRRYFRGKQLDSVMNYPVRNGIISFVLYGDGNMLYNILTELYGTYPRFVSDSLMNLLGTHDTERILTVLADKNTDSMTNTELATYRLSPDDRKIAVKRLMAASAIQYTVFGTPSLFYGDEAGMEGGHDPFCRLPYPWGREDETLAEHYRKLGMIRKTEDVYRHGDFDICGHGDGHFAFCRTKNRGKVYTYVNVSDREKRFDNKEKLIDLMTGEIITENKKIRLEALSFRILKVKEEDGNDI